MAVPTTITDLSTTAAANSPAGSESIGTSLDDYMRAIQAIIKQGVSKGSDIASAGTITPVATSPYFVVTGTTGITAIGETYSWVGRAIVLKFSGALVLTHSAGLILPGSANITTVAGNVGAFVNESAGVWRCLYLAPASLAANTFTGIQRWAKGADVASATALTLGTDGNYFDITGTTTITSIGTLGIGTWVRLHFDGALTFTHHATDLILPGAANITTAAGDEIELVEYATGDWRMVGGVKSDGTAWVLAATAVTPAAYTNANITVDQKGRITAASSGAAGGITLGTPVASTSGTSIDFTGIPAGTKRISINFAGVSTNGTSGILVQIGDSGGVENTGYTSTVVATGGALGTSTAGFFVQYNSTAASTFEGTVVLSLMDSATYTWSSIGVIARPDTHSTAGGSKSLSAELDRVRITTVGGADTFDAGKINISYE